MTIVTRSVFQEDNKYFQQVCLHECGYESVSEKIMQFLYNMYNIFHDKYNH